MSIWHVGIGLPGEFDFATIQAAVDAALNGDTIDIAAGTYREQATISGKVLTIHGAGDGHLACTRFRGHRVRCHSGAGGGLWNANAMHESSSLRL